MQAVTPLTAAGMAAPASACGARWVASGQPAARWKQEPPGIVLLPVKSSLPMGRLASVMGEGRQPPRQLAHRDSVSKGCPAAPRISLTAGRSLACDLWPARAARPRRHAAAAGNSTASTCARFKFKQHRASRVPIRPVAALSGAPRVLPLALSGLLLSHPAATRHGTILEGAGNPAERGAAGRQAAARRAGTQPPQLPRAAVRRATAGLPTERTISARPVHVTHTMFTNTNMLCL